MAVREMSQEMEFSYLALRTRVKSFFTDFNTRARRFNRLNFNIGTDNDIFKIAVGITRQNQQTLSAKIHVIASGDLTAVNCPQILSDIQIKLVGGFIPLKFFCNSTDGLSVGVG